jgi:hypothetical protein
MISALGVTTSVKEADLLNADGLQLSVTVTPSGYAPVAAGVPLMTPLDARLNPAGRLPELTDQAYGAVPPAAVSVALYEEAAAALGSALVLMTSGGTGDTTVRLNVVVAVCCGFPRSITVIPNVNAPETVGVPEITPVHDERLNPAGRAPDVIDQRKLGVPPDAVSVCE